MEEPLCFVRDNPFFKADGGCRRLVRRAPLILRGGHGPPALAVKEKLDMSPESESSEVEPASTSPDLEYGPGIVEKLKAKFSRLSGLTTRETKRRSPSLDELNYNLRDQHDYEPIRPVDPTILRRHSKSSSDILAEDARSYTVHRTVRLEEDEEPADAPSISTLRRKFEPADRSRSLSRSRPVSADYSQYQNLSVLQAAPHYEPIQTRTVRLTPREIEIPVASPPRVLSPVAAALSPVHHSPPHRELPVDVPSAVPVAPPVTAPPKEIEISRKLRVLEVLNHADDEPEFVKIGRRLRKSAAPPLDLFEPAIDDGFVHRKSYDDYAAPPPAVVQEMPKAYEHNNNNYQPAMTTEQPKVEQTRAPPPRKFIIRGEAHLPTLSNNFKIIREVPATNGFHHELPPDPEPMRRSSVDHHHHRVTSPVPATAPPPLSAPQGSPPPEEPRPSKPQPPAEPWKEEIQAERRKEVVREKESQKSEEGFSEVQRLLSKFQISRNSRGAYEIQPEMVLPSSQMQDKFSATVVGVHNSARQATAAGRVNVVSISVRSDAPSVITTKADSADVSPISTTTATKRPAPSPPDFSSAPQPQSQVEERKSLSSKYFEDKAKREKPYGDDVTELRPELRESSVDDEPVIEHIIPVQKLQEEENEPEESPYFTRPFTLTFPEPMIAGDGNPVRHTLLSLVMEEDIPQLLEAMSEKYSFVFEDLRDTPSTSSIIHPFETRKQRRQQRQVSSIKFQEESPVVYTYLDEDSQISEQWKEGAFLNYEQYQKLWEEEVTERELGFAELEKWKQEMARRWSTEGEQDISMTGSSLSGGLPDPSTISRAAAVA